LRVTSEGVLPAGVEAAWEHLVRWERQPRWMVDADEVRVVGAAREGVGVRIAVRTRVLGLAAFTEVLEVVGWEPPRLLRVEHTGYVRGAGEWRLEPVGADASHLSWTEELRLAPPVLGEAALRAYSIPMRRLMSRSIRGLARELGGNP
jgi:hypothetical protein